jgi:hypothetical protein
MFVEHLLPTDHVIVGCVGYHAIKIKQDGVLLDARTYPLAMQRPH